MTEHSRSLCSSMDVLEVNFHRKFNIFIQYISYYRVDGGDRDRGGVDRVPLMSNFTKLCLFVCTFILFYFCPCIPFPI